MIKMRTVLQRLMCFDAWSPVGGLFRKVMQVLRGRVLLEEVYHWGWDLSCAVG